jgi:hypothetical protein
MAFTDVIGFLGYILSASAYLLRIPETRGIESIIIGMILVSLGYISLASAKVIKFIEKEHKKSTLKWIPMIGNALLFSFFFLIYFIPNLTFHVRFYDLFAAIGYGLYVLAKWLKDIPMYVVAIPLVMYYFFGAAIKFSEEGWIDKLQLIARTLLIIYYASIPFVNY